MKELTKRQQELFDYIVSYREAHGYSPSWREMGRHMGITSTNGIHDHLRRLEQKGYLMPSNMEGRGRTTVPVQKSTATLLHWYRVKSGSLPRDGIREGDFLQIDPDAPYTTSYLTIVAIGERLLVRSPHGKDLVTAEPLVPDAKRQTVGRVVAVQRMYHQ